MCIKKIKYLSSLQNNDKLVKYIVGNFNPFALVQFHSCYAKNDYTLSLNSEFTQQTFGV